MLALPAWAADHYVPADFPTIQAAIDAAAGGDSIYVDSGTYGAIDLGDKHLFIIAVGAATIDGSGNNAAVTIADKQGVTNTRISGFTITNDSGYGILIAGAGDTDFSSGYDTSAYIDNNTIENCSDYGICLLYSNNSKLYSNLIQFNGGGIYGSYSKLVGTDADNTQWSGNTIIDNNSAGDGGGIFWEEGDLTTAVYLEFSNFIGYNSCAGSGGGIFFASSNDQTLATGTIENCTAGGYGGAICIVGLSANLTLDGTDWGANLQFDGNYAGVGGGALALFSGGNVLVYYTYIYDNQTAGYGGAIYTGSSPTIRLNLIYDNEAEDGGAIAILPPAGVGGGTWRNNIISSNTANSRGGAVYSHSDANFVSNYVHHNAAETGGAFFIRKSENIEYNYVTDNVALGEDGVMQVVNAVLPSVVDNEFRANIAGSGSGGIGILGTLTFGKFGNNLFEDNFSGSATEEGRGGALRVETDADAYAKVQNNTFDGNGIEAPGTLRGAAVFIDVQAPFDFDNNIVTNNLAGSGIYVTLGSRPWSYIYNNDSWNNTGSNWGGALANMTGINGNISANPLFAGGWDGDYFLSQSTGQAVTSPCVDAGDVAAMDPWLHLSDAKTRTDRVNDSGVVDLGYHYRPKDDDADGVPNLYELSPGIGCHPWVGDHPYSGVASFYNPEWALDASFDEILRWGDFDGLSVLEEYRLRINPQDFDTDMDGLADGDERRQEHAAVLVIGQQPDVGRHAGGQPGLAPSRTVGGENFKRGRVIDQAGKEQQHEKKRLIA